MENSFRFFANTSCRYYPCHSGAEELNCLFCFCPLYTREHCPGNPVWREKAGGRIKDCSRCIFPHVPEHYDEILRLLRNPDPLPEEAGPSGG